MSVNIEGNVGQTSAASGWYQNGRAVNAQEKEKDAPQPKADNAVKVSISQEGIESYRKQTREKGISGRGVVKGHKESVIRQAKQATSALSANAYGGELDGELEKLKGQRTGSAYGIADQMEDSVRAYANLYDEIVQGCHSDTSRLLHWSGPHFLQYLLTYQILHFQILCPEIHPAERPVKLV